MHRRRFRLGIADPAISLRPQQLPCANLDLKQPSHCFDHSTFIPFQRRSMQNPHVCKGLVPLKVGDLQGRLVLAIYS